MKRMDDLKEGTMDDARTLEQSASWGANEREALPKRCCCLGVWKSDFSAMMKMNEDNATRQNRERREEGFFFLPNQVRLKSEVLGSEEKSVVW
jgi:hypothetical protein